MALSEDQKLVIRQFPLSRILDHVRQTLLIPVADAPSEDTIADLLGALIGSPAAHALNSPSGNVAVVLFSILQNVRARQAPLKNFGPLVSLVAKQSSDATIWEAVYDLLQTLPPLTPPPRRALLPTFDGTPIRFSSDRLDDSETCQKVENEVFEELKGCTFRNVRGFVEKFFNPDTWRADQRAQLETVMTAYDSDHKIWSGFPTVTDEVSVWEWLRGLEDRLKGAPHQLFTTRTAHEFIERKGQLDVFFKTTTSTPTRKVAMNAAANAADMDKGHRYKDVLAVGELKKSYRSGNFKPTFKQIARLVRNVFTDQPIRRFVHAFSLCGTKMELWIFDRSGAYSSGPFDINEQPSSFARAFVGYLTMDDDPFGLDTFRKRDRENGLYQVTLDDESSGGGGKVKFTLGEAMVRRRAIACRATTCYRTMENQVVKFSWNSDKREAEAVQLRLAREKGVQGVASLVAYTRITSINELRQGLEFPESHKFRPVKADEEQGRKRKRLSGNDDRSAEFRRKKRLMSHPSSISLTPQKTNHTSQGLCATNEDQWDNRIFTCLVVSPAGRVLHEFQSIRELLHSMRDAVRAHQSLYETGGILHRDISPNNIIIIDGHGDSSNQNDGFKGMLIDLDLAKTRDSGPSGARHQTGTVQFMAIEVLDNYEHTYRHDLESFFYVLLWLCLSYDLTSHTKKVSQRVSLLDRWTGPTIRNIIMEKKVNVSANGWDDLLDEFPEECDTVKILCTKIRSILFGDNAKLFYGTPEGQEAEEAMYRDTIAAYNEAIAKLSD